MPRKTMSHVVPEVALGLTQMGLPVVASTLLV